MSSKEEDIAWLKSTFHPIPKPILPDDCIEYCLYIFDSQIDRANDSALRNKLKEVQKAAVLLQKEWLSDYIWQRQSFNLELVESKDDKPSYLRGRTEYGDSIEDEWVIVWLLRDLTKKFVNLWVKVTDSDGEFLLIEASGTIPPWLEPEVAENRVWINNTHLKILTPEKATRASRRTEEKLSIEMANEVICTQPKRVMHSTIIEEEAFYRLRNYPGQIKDNIHHAILRIPRKLAYLILQKAAYVAPAVEAFYLRDPISLKPFRSDVGKLLFPPQDLVDLSVAFPRVAYAQLKSQDVPVLEPWKDILTTAIGETHTKLETGMRLTAGFEMLLTDKHYQDRSDAREMVLLLEDLESGDVVQPNDDILAEIALRHDDEKWLDISLDDLQQELSSNKKDNGKKVEFGDKGAQENLQRIVKQFESFLNGDKSEENAGIFAEGDSDSDDLDDLDSDDLEEDKEASFDDDEFTSLMQEMMGMPAEVMQELKSGQIDALTNGIKSQHPSNPSSSMKVVDVEDSSLVDEEDEADEDVEELMRRMGSELKTSGAFDTFEDDHQVAGGELDNGDYDELSSDDEDLLDPQKEQLAKDLLESLKAQGGASGPAASLMALMAQQYAQDDAKSSSKRDKGKRPA